MLESPFDHPLPRPVGESLDERPDTPRYIGAYRDPRLVGKASSDLTPFLARNGEEIMSEGYPQTPGNPDSSGLHTPYFIDLLWMFNRPAMDVQRKTRDLHRIRLVGAPIGRTHRFAPTPEHYLNVHRVQLGV